MERFSQERFNNFVLDCNVIGFFEEPVTLKSGRQSNWYVNWREVSNDAWALRVLATHVADFLHDSGLNPDSVYGVPEGATKVAIVTQLECYQRSPKLGPGSHSVSMGRGKPKEHGKPEDRYFLGMPHGRTVVLEDVTTTGGSLIAEIEKLWNADVDVVAAIGLTNRMEMRDNGFGVEGALYLMNVPYHSLSNALDLLPLAYQRLQPGRDIAQKVEAEFRQFGIRPIHLGE